MKKFATLSLAVGLLAFIATPADAFFGCRKKSDCCPPPCAPACGTTACCSAPPVTYVEKTVTCYRPEWKERDVTYTVNKMHTRVETVPVKCNVMVPVWTDKKQMVTCYSHKPKEVERDVRRCQMIPVTYTDPCTGYTRTCCKPQWVTEKVKCTVMECVPEQKEVTVKVCAWKSEEKTYETKRTICEWKPETVTAKQRYCEMVPYQTTVRVPSGGCGAANACCKSACDTGCGSGCGRKLLGRLGHGLLCCR